MNELQIIGDHEAKFWGKFVWRELLFGTFVGVSEGIIIYVVMEVFGMFEHLPIYG